MFPVTLFCGVVFLATLADSTQFTSGRDTHLRRKSIVYTNKPSVWRLSSPTNKDSISSESEIRPQFVYPSTAIIPVDQDIAASEHGHHGRVHIKVFRGPDDHHDHFAPHGYWVKQPADD